MSATGAAHLPSRCFTGFASMGAIPRLYSSRPPMPECATHCQHSDTVSAEETNRMQLVLLGTPERATHCQHSDTVSAEETTRIQLVLFGTPECATHCQHSDIF
jgi:hypothetical protein